MLLPDGKPLFKEQTERDRLVKEARAKRAAKTSPSRLLSMSSTDALEEMETEAKNKFTAMEGFVLRWQDRVSLRPSERDKLGILIGDSDHYMEHVIRDVAVRKVVEMPYEPGKHRSYR